MLDVVQALEGTIAPMECFHADPEGKVSCSHETDDEACATKLLWTRVQGGVSKALSGTTVADLVEFSERSARPRSQNPRRRRLAPRDPESNRLKEPNWQSLRSATCT